MACFVAAVRALAEIVARRTIMVKPLAVVAVGGNALIPDEQHNGIPDQYVAVKKRAAYR